MRLSTSYLASHGSTTPRLDAELLTAEALDVRRIDLYLRFDQPLAPSDVTAIRERVRRRASGEPVAYITGRREFYGRSFRVSPSVLIPRPDTETLVEAALQLLRDAPDPCVVWDLGTGSGCIGITLALEVPAVRVEASDVSDAAVQVAQENVTAHDVRDRVRVAHGSWAEPLAEAPWLVVSNPPYVTHEELRAAQRDVRDHEPALALDGGGDGLDAYRALLQSLSARVDESTRLLLEVDPRRADAVAATVRELYGDAATRTIPDLTGRARVLECMLPAPAHVVAASS